MNFTRRIRFACCIVMLHAVMHHVASALSLRPSAFHQVRGSTAAAFSSWSSTGALKSYSTSIRRNNIRLLVKVSTHTEDFYEEQISFSNSNFNNDILSDESIQSAREQIQPHFPFPLDPWQLSAGASILADHNVIVCAPTGAGKTVSKNKFLATTFTSV